jgi:hypothetical protein
MLLCLVFYSQRLHEYMLVGLELLHVYEQTDGLTEREILKGILQELERLSKQYRIAYSRSFTSFSYFTGKIGN